MVGKIGSFERFNAEVKKFAKDLTEVELVLFHKKVSFEAFSRIVQKTPVDTGRARGNWQLTIGAPAEDVLENFPDAFNVLGSAEDEAGIERALSQLSDLKPFQVVFISNNVAYIIFLEEGTSKQAPQGMVAETFEELLQIFPGAT